MWVNDVGRGRGEVGGDEQTRKRISNINETKRVHRRQFYKNRKTKNSYKLELNWIGRKSREFFNQQKKKQKKIPKKVKYKNKSRPELYE